MTLTGKMMSFLQKKKHGDTRIWTKNAKFSVAITTVAKKILAVKTCFFLIEN